MEHEKTEKPRAFGKTAEIVEPMNEDGSVNASEDEQLQYDMIVTRAIKMIHGKGQDNILKTLGSSERPAQGMGQVTSQLITVLQQSAKESGTKISDEVLSNAGMEIIEELSELAENKGIFTYENIEEEESEIADAAMYAIKFYEEQRIKSGQVTPEDRDKMKTDITQEVQKEQATVEPQEEPAGGMVASQMSGGV